MIGSLSQEILKQECLARSNDSDINEEYIENLQAIEKILKGVKATLEKI